MWSIWYHRFKFPVIAILVLTYFGFHGYHGNRGYITRIQLEGTVAKLQSELVSTKAKREYWQHRTELMASDRIDYDLLDERSRQVTAKIRDGEVILSRVR